jgi:hypothetical protein
MDVTMTWGNDAGKVNWTAFWAGLGSLFFLLIAWYLIGTWVRAAILWLWNSGPPVHPWIGPARWWLCLTAAATIWCLVLSVIAHKMRR